MGIELDGPEYTEEAEKAGRLLYDVIRAALSRMQTGEQVTLGFAIQKGAKWLELSPPQRRAFVDAAEDLEL